MSRHRYLLAAALLASSVAAPAMATAQALSGYIDSATRKTVLVESNRPLPTIGKQEGFQLVAGNVASDPVTVAGGDYILSQTCTGYGSLALQALGPDGTTWLTFATYTATDTGSAHGLVLGSFAKVRVAITGTTGCNALLSRVPA